MPTYYITSHASPAQAHTVFQYFAQLEYTLPLPFHRLANVPAAPATAIDGGEEGDGERGVRQALGTPNFPRAEWAKAYDRLHLMNGGTSCHVKGQD